MVAGIIFIALGMMVKWFPNVLAGFNLLSQNNQDQAKKNGLPNLAFTVFMGMGLVDIFAYFLSIWLDQPSISKTIISFTTIVGAVIIIIFGNLITNRRTS